MIIKVILTFNKGNDSIGVLHTIHVNYNGKDLQRVAEEKKLNNKELISIHSNKIYFVQFLGFIPGFAYLGTLDKRISLPRKKNPDKHVPKGSVAIAENYTAIYPVNSPGGWNIIGHTEYEILNKKFSIKFKPGDKVKFVSNLNVLFKNKKMGIASTIQDNGRFFYRELGVPVSGAFDKLSAQIANILLKNNANTPVIEFFSGPIIEFDVDVFISVTGANINVYIDENLYSSGGVYFVKSGSILNLSKFKNGRVGYLAIGENLI